MKRFLMILLVVILSVGLIGCESAETSEPEEPIGDKTVEWPLKDVTVVVPAEAGSLLDLMARIMTDYLQDTTGKAFVVQNDVSGNGTVAYEKVRNAKPDGATLLFTQNLFLQYHGGVYDKNPWDNFEVIAVGPEAKEGYILVARSNEEYSTWEEVVEYAKAHPGELTAGIQNGGMAHMLQGILNDQCGIEMKEVEAGSSAEKITAILGGHVDIAFVAAHTGSQYVESGDLISLMTTSLEPSVYNSEWPTTTELGYPDVINVAAAAWFAPKGTDPKIIKTINDVLAGMADDPKVLEQNEKLDVYYEHITSEEAVELLKKNEETIINGYEIIGKAN